MDALKDLTRRKEKPLRLCRLGVSCKTQGAAQLVKKNKGSQVFKPWHSVGSSAREKSWFGNQPFAVSGHGKSPLLVFYLYFCHYTVLAKQVFKGERVLLQTGLLPKRALLDLSFWLKQPNLIKQELKCTHPANALPGLPSHSSLPAMSPDESIQVVTSQKWLPSPKTRHMTYDCMPRRKR